MSAYTALLGARYRLQLQYRAAALAGVVTQVFWGFVRIMVLDAFYRSSPDAPPLSLSATLAYVWLGQAFLALLPWNRDREIDALVRSGDVVFEWVRPVDLYGVWYTRALALRAGNASLRCVPLLLFAGVLLPLTPLADWALPAPASAGALAGFAFAMVVALGLGAAITNLMHVSLLWTISGAGVAVALPPLVTLLSGLVIPLPLLPERVQTLLQFLPFAALADIPYRIYSGDLSPAQAAPALGVAVLWALALVALGRWGLERGYRRLVVQGG